MKENNLDIEDFYIQENPNSNSNQSNFENNINNYSNMYFQISTIKKNQQSQ